MFMVEKVVVIVLTLPVVEAALIRLGETVYSIWAALTLSSICACGKKVL